MTDYTTIEGLHRRLEQLTSELPIAESEYKHLSDFSNPFKSELMKKYASISPSSSAKAQERDALADSEYLSHLEGKRVAHAKYLKLKYERDAINSRISVWQTQSALEREKMRRGII